MITVHKSCYLLVKVTISHKEPGSKATTSAAAPLICCLGDFSSYEYGMGGCFCFAFQDRKLYLFCKLDEMFRLTLMGVSVLPHSFLLSGMLKWTSKSGLSYYWSQTLALNIIELGSKDFILFTNYFISSKLVVYMRECVCVCMCTHVCVCACTLVHISTCVHICVFLFKMKDKIGIIFWSLQLEKTITY